MQNTFDHKSTLPEFKATGIPLNYRAKIYSHLFPDRSIWREAEKAGGWAGVPSSAAERSQGGAERGQFASTGAERKYCNF